MSAKQQADHVTERYAKHASMLMVFVAVFFAGCGSARKAKADEAASAPTVGVIVATRKDLSSTLQIASEFEPYQEVEVYAKVSGYVRKLNVDWGTHVQRGELLAVLEIPELQQQLALDEAAVRRSEHDLVRVQDELAQANSRYQVANLTYKRLANVIERRPGLVAQEEVDVAQGKNLEARAGVSGADAAVSAAQQTLAIAKASLEKDRVIYGYSRIIAPFDGVVTRLSAYSGALLPAGTSSSKGDLALCRLAQTNLLRLVIPLPERAVPDSQLGETVEVRVSSKEKMFMGKIVRFSGQIDTQTRTMRTEVNVPNSDYELVPGMYARVHLPLHTEKNALTVPSQAVQISGEGRGTVLVADSSNRIEKREVALGISSATDTQILSGLREGEKIVFGEQSQYKTGQLVRPRTIQPPEGEQ